MASKGKRVIASLFGIHLNEDVPQLESLVPQRISTEIMSGQLPTFRPATLLLGKNETCHFMNRGALAIKQKEKTYQTRRSGGSYKLTKNYTIHSSNARTKPVEQEWYEFKEGVVFVTNERIIFVAPEHGFEKKIKNISAIIPYADAISLQFGSQTITIMMPDAQLMAIVLQQVH